MALEIARRLIGGTWRTGIADETGGGGAIPDPVTTPINVAVEGASSQTPYGDAGLTVLGPQNQTATWLAEIQNFNGWGLSIRREGGVFITAESGVDTLEVGPSGHDGALVVADSGLVVMGHLPIEDPLVAGGLWNDGGTLKISAGPPP